MKQKLQYIWDYYKLPIFFSFALICVLLSLLHQRLHKKETILCLSFVNVSASDTLMEKLTDGFLAARKFNASRNKISLTSGLYLTEDATAAEHEYTYASRMKILGSINAEKMDVVFMNREAFDTFAQNGYLYNLEQLSLPPASKACLVSNTHIIKDNATDVFLDKNTKYQAVTEDYLMGLKVNSCPVLKAAGFTDDLYLGIIKNSPRKKAAADYISYLFDKSSRR